MKRQAQRKLNENENAVFKGAYDVGLPSLYINYDLSPKNNRELLSDYPIMDGNVHQIRNMII